MTQTASLTSRVREAMGDLVKAMEPDGGGADLVDIGESSVTLRLVGSCTVCPSRALSAAALVRRLRERVPELSKVVVLYPGMVRNHP